MGSTSPGGDGGGECASIKFFNIFNYRCTHATEPRREGGCAKQQKQIVPPGEDRSGRLIRPAESICRAAAVDLRQSSNKIAIEGGKRQKTTRWSQAASPPISYRRANILENLIK